MDYIYVSFLRQSFLNYLAYCLRDGLSYLRQLFTSVIFELLGLMLKKWIIISTSVFTLVIFLITWFNAGEMDYHIYVSFLHQSFLNYLAYCWRDGLSYLRQFFTSVIFELLGILPERWITISTLVFLRQSFLNYLAYCWRDGLSYLCQFLL